MSGKANGRKNDSSNECNQNKLLTPTLVMAWFVNLFQFMTFFFLATTMALYAIEEYGANEAKSGLAASSFVIGATIARIFSGYVVDSIGRKPTMFVAMGALVVFTGLYLLPSNYWAFIAVRVVHGAGYAFMSTAIMSIVQTVIPPARRGEGTGYFALGSTLSTALGPAFAVVIVNNLGYRGLFGVVFSFTIISLAMASLLKIPPQHFPEKAKFTFKSMIQPSVVGIGLFMLLMAVAYSGVITFVNLFSTERGIHSGVEVFFASYAVVAITGRFFLGRIQDRHGDNIVFYFGITCFLIAFIILSFAHHAWMLAIAGAIMGGGFGSLVPAAQTAAVKRTPPHKLGAGMSTLFLLMDLGMGLGPIFLGFYLAATGFTTLYLTLACVVGAGGLLYLLILRNHPKPGTTATEIQ